MRRRAGRDVTVNRGVLASILVKDAKLGEGCFEGRQKHGLPGKGSGTGQAVTGSEFRAAIQPTVIFCQSALLPPDTGAKVH